MRSDIDHVGIRMLDSRQILGPQMVKFAERARDQAARIAPKDSGEYAATMFARKSRGKFSTAVYGSDRYYARFIEYGSRTSPPKPDASGSTVNRWRRQGRSEWRIKPHHTLFNAAVQVGLRVRSVRKAR